MFCFPAFAAGGARWLALRFGVAAPSCWLPWGSAPALRGFHWLVFGGPVVFSGGFGCFFGGFRAWYIGYFNCPGREAKKDAPLATIAIPVHRGGAWSPLEVMDLA